MPTKPSMTDSVARLLSMARTMPVSSLPHIGPITRKEAQDYLNMMAPLMRPASRPQVLARILVLMAHYWTADMPETMQEAIALDWGYALSDLPWNVVEATALEWVKTKERRPTPAAFLKLSDQFIRQDLDDCQLLRHILRRDWDGAGKS